MHSWTLSDGTTITLGYGSNLPPGASGQHIGRNYVWYKINSGEWRRSNHRNGLSFYEWVQCSENLADFMEGENQ